METLFYCIIELVLVGLPVTALYFVRDKPFWQTTLIKSLRFFLGFLLFGAGLVRFTPGAALGLIGPPWLISEMAKQGLGFYATFISISEIFIGFLLMTNRFGTLGAIMSFPMFANILAVVISLHWKGTPFVVAGLLVLNGVVLFHDWHKLKFIVTDDIELLKKQRITRSHWQLDASYGIVFLVFMMAVVLSYFNQTIAGSLSWLGYFLMFALWLYGMMKR